MNKLKWILFPLIVLLFSSTADAARWWQFRKNRVARRTYSAPKKIEKQPLTKPEPKGIIERSYNLMKEDAISQTEATKVENNKSAPLSYFLLDRRSNRSYNYYYT
jgi:hypothetical protein